jgi:hypothetical protein
VVQVELLTVAQLRTAVRAEHGGAGSELGKQPLPFALVCGAQATLRGRAVLPLAWCADGWLIVGGLPFALLDQ